MTDPPREVVLDFPLAERVHCPRCWGTADPSLRSRGVFSDPAHLSKHLKACHPGDKVSYKCSVCEYKGVSRYPLKDVKVHFEKLHSGRQDDAPAAARSLTGAEAGRARTRVGSVRTRASENESVVSARPASRLQGTRASPSYAAVTAANVVQPSRVSPLTAGARATVVTRAPATRTTTRSGAAATSTRSRAAAILTATTAATTTTRAASTAVSTPPTTGVAEVSASDRRTTSTRTRRPTVSVPVCSACGVSRASASAVISPRPGPSGVTRTARAPPSAASTSSAGSEHASPAKRRRLGAARRVRASPGIVPITSCQPGGSSTRSSPPPVNVSTADAATTSAPVVKSATGRNVASRAGPVVAHAQVCAQNFAHVQDCTQGPARVSAHALQSAHGSRVHTGSEKSPREGARTPPANVGPAGSAQGSEKSPSQGARTPPAANKPAGSATGRHTARKASQFIVQGGGIWDRSPRPPSSSPEGFSEVQVAGVLGRRTTPASRPPPPASSAARPSAAIATSSPATLVTCTVTTSVCGAPVMSTGTLTTTRRPATTPMTLTSAGGGFVDLTTPSPLPQERRQQQQQQHTTSSRDGEGDEEEDGSWRLSLRRRAKRRIGSGSLSSTPTPPSSARGPVIGPRVSPSPPQVTLANYPPLPSAAEERRGICSRNTLSRPYAPRGFSSSGNTPPLPFVVEAEVHCPRTPPPPSAAERNIIPPTNSPPSPSAMEDAVFSEDHRSEMATRDLVEASSGGTTSPGDRADGVEPARDVVGGNLGRALPAATVDVRGVMGRRGTSASVTGAGDEDRSGPVGRRRVRQRDVRPAEAQRGEPSRGQRMAARDALVALAEAAATPAELEELAVQAARFFGGGGEDVVAAAAPGACERSARSREAAVGRRGRDVAHARYDARGPAPAGAQRYGEGRGDRTREATRIQALYRRNRRKAVREVVQGPTELCQVPARAVQAHFERLYCGEGRLDGLPAAEPVDPPSREDAEHLMAPFAEGEVDRRLRRMTNTAPGPDGATYRDLRERDPGARLLAATFNACYRLGAVPPSWKNSNTVLVYKKGDRADLDNWRPIALGDTVPKLFAAVVADRLTDWAIAHDKLSRAQKGFLRDEGCFEHNFVLQEILTDARRTRRQAVVAWLDLSNAFGSVPHNSIRCALVGAGVPSGLINIWGSMYDGCTTRVRTVDGYTAPIPIRSGVRQGCPLSPIVFNLAIDSVVRAAADVGDVGYELFGTRFNTLAYADDIALIADTPEGMRRLLTAVELEAGSVGLHFNAAKCASLHVTAGRVGRVRPTTFEIEGRPVPSLAEGESYRHLGVPTGFAVDQTPLATIEGVLKDIRAVDASLLAPWQRVEVLSAFILPRLDFLLRGATVEKRLLKGIDLLVRRVTKSWLNLPQRASAELVYIPPSWGGCGLIPSSDLADVLATAHAFRMLTAADPVVRDLAWGSLRGVVARRIGHAPDCDEIASFLSGSLEGRMRGGGEASLWSRARNAARRQAAKSVIRWQWSWATGEMTVECRGLGGRTVKVPESARAQVINRLRSAVMCHYLGTLLGKPDQGKVVEVSSRIPVSNHFMRGGSFTRFADWRFVHRARLDVLPLNGARRWASGDDRCRRCGRTAETLPHVVGHCGVHAAAIQLRHDAVLHRLRKACRLPGEVRVNRRVDGVDGELEGLRPDLVVRHEPSKSVVICDVTVAFENRLVAFEEARGRKLAKYAPLAEALRAQGYRVVVTALVVGALGSWCPRNDAVLSLLRVGSKYGAMMRRLIVSDTIRWSRDIYVEHVSGVRQYPAPLCPPGEVRPEASPPRAIRQRWPDALNGNVRE